MSPSRQGEQSIDPKATSPEQDSFLLKLDVDSLQEVRHVVTAEQFTPEFLEHIFVRAAYFKNQVLNKKPLDIKINPIDPMVSLFNEPSTRTRFSFEFAAARLGLPVITTEAGKVFSSTVKGESIEDTAINIAGYHPSVVVARFSDTGDAAKMANSLGEIPLLNGGDGKGEHPTQALLDMFTILEHKGRLNNLNVVMGGDTANGRTARSLAQALSLYQGNSITFVSPDELRMGADIRDTLEEKGVEVHETTRMSEALPHADVVYWTRLQAERFRTNNPDKKQQMRERKLAMIAIQPDYSIGLAELRTMKSDAVLMHPLPRVRPGFVDSEGDELEPELKTEVDSNVRAIYFNQSENGMYVRMALLEWVLERCYGLNN